MSHNYWMTAVTADQAKGNRIGGIVGACSDDDKMFTLCSIPCYSQGTTFTATQDGPLTVYVPSAAPVAWAVTLAVRDAVAPYIAEFRDGGYPAPLLAAGMSNDEIDDHRAALTLEVGDRATYEGRARTFLTSLGYVLAPES
jgi:hypothetical protein